MFIQQIQSEIQKIIAILLQLRDEDYGRPLPVLNNSSIGAHTRHVIEFFVELEAGWHDGVVNYDNRKRRKMLEENKEAAIAALQDIIAASNKPDRSMQLAVHYQAEGTPPTLVATTYFRELVFAIEHTVHHMALMRIGIEHLQTVVVPAGFGIAASTQRFQSSCAQ